MLYFAGAKQSATRIEKCLEQNPRGQGLA
ncbi:hypothetical protein DB345_00285 [Spartobacteria bacterium LR76]|nr:hypothetical protein DB345_00285 [Spartobacteria bacterium LR76]